MKVSSFCALLLLSLAVFTRSAFSQKLPSEARGSSTSQVVMLSVNTRGCAAGIVVGYDTKSIYVATAEHVISQANAHETPPVTVRFYGLRDTRRGRVFSKSERPNAGDLAIVLIDRDELVNKFLDGLNFAMLSPVAASPPNAPVTSIGCFGGTFWANGTEESLLASDQDYLHIQSNVNEGQSGGGLFNDAWELIGMPLDLGVNQISARPIAAVLSDLRNWGVPVLLTIRPLKDRVMGAEDIARQHAAISKSRELVAASLASLSDDPDRSILLAMYAISTTWSFDKTVEPEAEEQLHRALLSSRSSLTLSRHEKPITSIAWSPNGALLATSSQDGYIRIANAKTGVESLVLQGHKGVVHAIAWSPSGAYLASGGEDGTTRVWDVTSGSQLKVFSRNSGEVRSVAWTKDSKNLAYGSNQLVVRNMETDEEAVLGSFGGNFVLSLAWTPDGKLLAAGVSDYSTHIFESAVKKEIKLLPTRDYVRCVGWSPDGSHLATEDFGQVVVFERATWKVSARITGMRAIVNSLSWNPNGKMLATADDENPKVWDVESGKLLLTLLGHTSWVTAVMWSPSGHELASGSNDFTGRIWNTSLIKEVQAFSGTAGMEQSVAWSPDGKYLAHAAQSVAVWRLDDGAQTYNIDVSTDVGVNQYQHFNAIAWSPNHDIFVAAEGPVPFLTEWDATSGRSLMHVQSYPAQAPSEIAWSPDGRAIAMVGGIGDFFLRNAETLEGKAVEATKQFFRAVAWSPDGARLATGSIDATVDEDGKPHTYHNPTTIWDAATGKTIRTLSDHNVISIAWSPDGRRLATAQDRAIKIWDTTSGEQLLQLTGHRDVVQSVAWSPDGKFLASGAPDKLTKIWDAETGRELMSLSGHDNSVFKVTWNHTGDRLASVGVDGTVQVYAMSVSELMAIGKQRVTRKLTSDECRQYFQLGSCPGIPDIPRN